MKFPGLPRKGQPVADTAKEIINYMRSSRVLSINGVTGKSTSNGTTFQIPVGKAGKAGGGGSHMWKTTAAGEVDGSYTYKVKAGITVIQGTRAEVAEVPALVGGMVAEAGDNGIIYLRVTRNTASRAYDETVPPEIIFSATALSSDYVSEVTALAEITDGVISQCRNDEICSAELMIVANGEFALIPLQANSRNAYIPF